MDTLFSDKVGAVLVISYRVSDCSLLTTLGRAPLKKEKEKRMSHISVHQSDLSNIRIGKAD